MPLLPVGQLPQAKTKVNIVYTTPAGTRAALTAASSFSEGMEINIRILAFQVVPYPLDIDKPAVQPDFAINHILMKLVPYSDRQFTLQYMVCRDRDDALIQCLEPKSLVVIGGR